MTAVELWVPPPHQINCSMPPLSRDMFAFTLDNVKGEIIACDTNSCDQLTETGWKVFVPELLEGRWYHTSAVTSKGLLLVGGGGSWNTTESVPFNGGESVKSFPLEPGRYLHCSIQITESTIVLTGNGGPTPHNAVHEYSNLEGEVTSRELPSLIFARYNHACGMYSVGTSKVSLGLNVI